MMTDPIADMLTRIRNAQAIRKKEVVLPFSKIKFEIAKILKHEDYIAGFEKIEVAKFPEIKIILKYDEDKQPAITNIERISKPGRRVYLGSKNMPSVLNNFGLAIVTTNRGVMTAKEAKKEKVGGEIICQVW